MNEQAEEAARVLGAAVVKGDLGTTVRSMTPDGLAKLMEISGRTWFNYSDFHVQTHGADGDDLLIDILYETDLEPLTLRYRFRQVEGQWKVADLERIV